MAKRTGVFMVKTNWWYIERLVWLIAGTDVLVSSVLAAAHHPNWAFSILFVGLCSICVALTGFCIVGNVLYWCGVQPLVPDKKTLQNGKWGSLYFMQTDEWFLERYIYVFVGVNLSIVVDARPVRKPRLVVLHGIRRFGHHRVRFHRVLHYGEPALSPGRGAEDVPLYLTTGTIRIYSHVLPALQGE